MATKKQKEELMEVLKFTPRTYKIRLWGYGGEYVMGSVDRKIYDYFRQRRLDISEYAWDGDYANEHNIPEDMRPFYAGSWHDCDDMGHCWGVDRSAGTIQVEDELGNIVYEKSLEDIHGMGVDEENPENSEPELSTGDEVWIDMKPAGTVVFLGVSSEKGTFFEGELPLTAPFNPGKITINTDDFDGNEIVTSLQYNGEDIDNWGGDTNGKGSDFGLYVAGSNKQDGKGYTRYRNMDDIEYGMTEWFPKKVKPVREGLYMIRTAGRNSYTHQAKWTGTRWISSWQEDGSGTEEIKIKEWQGIAYDPDEHYLREELDNIAAENPGFPTAALLDELEKVECVQCDWQGSVEETFSNDHDEMICPKCSSPVEFVNGGDNTDELEASITPFPGTKNNSGWPFGPAETKDNEVEEETTLTYWTVKPLDKKSIEEQEEFTKDGMTLTRKTGWRWGEWTVATNDGNPPEFEFDGNGQLDINSCYSNNIEEVEMVETNDGCWEDIEWPEEMSEEDQEKLQEFIDEEGFYELESQGWMHSETYMYIWGPIEISNESGEVVKVVNE